MRLSVVIPAYNEARTIDEVVRRVREVDLGPDFEREIIVVDDASTDATARIIGDIRKDEPELVALRHPVNKGKGAALRTGFQAATGDIVLIQDADLELDPADHPRLLRPILTGEADVVYGSRFLEGTPSNIGMVSFLANRALTALTNLACGTALTDMETGHKVFRREVIQSIPLTANRFAFEPEVTVKLARRRVLIREVPTTYAARSREEGKHIGWKDGLAAIGAILRYRLMD